jgi:hypothetical protein
VEESDRVPSVGCLLYLVADQVAPRWRGIWQDAKVPCKRARVLEPAFSAVAGTATYLWLRDSGHVTLRLAENPDSPRRRGRHQRKKEIEVGVLDRVPPPGAPGALLTATLAIPYEQHPDLRRIGARPSALGGGMVFFIRSELLELGYASPGFLSFDFLTRFDCARIAALEGACADALRWWQQVQASEASLCSGLLEACRIALMERPSGGG